MLGVKVNITTNAVSLHYLTRIGRQFVVRIANRCRFRIGFLRHDATLSAKQVTMLMTTLAAQGEPWWLVSYVVVKVAAGI